MNVKDTLRILCSLPPGISVLLESDNGLGKSLVVARAAAIMSQRLNKPFGFLDFRLVQGEITHSVFRNGVIEEKRQIINATIHDMAEWFPTDPDSCGFLFLDELPRAPRDVQNAVLELAPFRSLPAGWRVISAANAGMDVYSATQLDPVLYDRFLKIDYKPTMSEWLEFTEDSTA